MPKRSERDEHGSPGASRIRQRGDLHGEPGLADASGTQHGEQTMTREQRFRLGNFPLRPTIAALPASRASLCPVAGGDGDLDRIRSNSSTVAATGSSPSSSANVLRQA
jgi:hypothetical protein